MWEGEAVPVMLVFIMMPSVLSPDAFVEPPLGAISAVSEVVDPFIEHGGKRGSSDKNSDIRHAPAAYQACNHNKENQSSHDGADR